LGRPGPVLPARPRRAGRGHAPPRLDPLGQGRRTLAELGGAGPGRHDPRPIPRARRPDALMGVRGPATLRPRPAGRAGRATGKRHAAAWPATMLWTRRHSAIYRTRTFAGSAS